VDPTARQRGVERNVRLYPLYQALFNAYCWMPVFFLYFSEHLPLAQVLQLEAIYYVAVVSLEVPSGYFSDVIGRRPTLLISTSSLVLAYVLFFWGGSFAVFAAAQVCLAAGIAFNSGTDTALHFDSLIGLGRSAEYGAREAAAHRNALVARSLAALAGGLIGAWQLRLTYGLSALAALGALGVVVMMTEPSHGDDDPPRRFGFVRQVTACLRQLRKRALAWLFTFAVLMTVINHIPYELYQPYLDLLISERDIRLPGDATPMVTGAVTALTMLIASWAAARSIRLRDRVGLPAALLLTTAIQVVIMAAMGFFLNEFVVLLILMRSMPAAMLEPPLRAAVAPQVPRSLRATYFSLQSLAGRLSFACVLALLSLAMEQGAAPDWPAISLISLACAGLGGAGFLVLVATARACLARRAEDSV
jgi:MFS family permease